MFEGKLAYTPDVWEVPETSLKALEGIDTWITDALRYNTHPTHAHADKSLAWLAKVKARRGILTNLHIDMDYVTLKKELFGTIEAGYDGMELILDL